MTQHTATYPSQLYREFMEIEPGSYHQIIRFVEGHESELEYIYEEERFELLESYVSALFEVGAYRKHLHQIDRVIEEIMEHNIRFYKGEDVFQKMLFRKAASHFQLLEYEQAEFVLMELLRINPAYADAAQFLKKCRRVQRPRLLRQSKALSVLLFMLAALVIAVEVLVVRNFYPGYAGLVETTRLSLMGSGLIVLFGGDLIHRLLIEADVSDFLQEARRRKNWID